nr:PREDICTED: uncharacterized protein LOC105663728 [Megachile rotundata]
MSLSRRSECPGPCNPRNRGCRRNCVQNVASILEELPPCIRMRLCEEDLFAVLAKNEQTAPTPSSPRNVSTTVDYASSIVHPTWLSNQTTKPGKDDAISGASRGKTDQEEKQSGEDQISMIEDKDTQTEPTDMEAAKTTIEANDTIGMRALPQAKNAIARETCAPNSTRDSPYACRRINTTVYTAILLLLAVFAWNSPAYRIFLSSQICGILVVLSWKISGSVPF